jgi:hypothetical protein
MYRDNRPEAETTPVNPLKIMTAEQFAALGGVAVAYVRPITGKKLAPIVSDAGLEEDDDEYQLVMSADGRPLLVADTAETVQNWLSEANIGIVSLH